MVCVSPVDTRMQSTCARYTSRSKTLQRWRLADPHFARGLNATGEEVRNLGSSLFHRLPNPSPGGPTHIIAGNCGETPPPFFLGKYDAVREVLDVSGPPQWIEASRRLPWVDPSNPYLPGKSQLTWAAAGGTMDGSRLLFVGWLRQWLNTPGVNVFAAGNPLSLVREIVYEASTNRLLSRPVQEYELLRRATFLDGAHLGVLGPASPTKTLPVPVGLGGALDICLSFDLAAAGRGSLSEFGLAVRAPPSGVDGAAVVATFNVSAAAAGKGTRSVELVVNGVVSAVLPLLRNETTVDVRVLVDRPIVEIFVNGGRGAFVYGDSDFDSEKTSVHVLNAGRANVSVSSASVFGMGCGWRADAPAPRR